ncbi:DUF692 domain-containing protein [Piscinibacter sakaiensis]|uniref:DUF692 domain-containing protein n=1 Tax=Piscinibacter sakaiensis TaxID=1547922 RepID=UPI00372C5867
MPPFPRCETLPPAGPAGGPVAAGPLLAGIGLKAAHADTALATGSSADFFEVHAENAMVAGGPIRRRLERLRARWPLSVHGVGLSLGGADRPDPVHLARFAEVVRWLQPRWVSEHLAWSVHGGRYHADLLPLAYDEAALRRVADHVDEVQAAIGRPLLVENPATYLQFEASTLAEAEFLAALVRRSGCGLLLDLTNAEVSAVNHAGDAAAFVRALPAASVGEIHLAGPVRGRGPGGRARRHRPGPPGSGGGAAGAGRCGLGAATGPCGRCLPRRAAGRPVLAGGLGGGRRAARPAPGRGCAPLRSRAPAGRADPPWRAGRLAGRTAIPHR